MNKFNEFISKPCAHFFCFSLCVIFLNWPILTIADNMEKQVGIFLYLFLVWSFMIVLLFLIGRQCRKYLDTQGKNLN